MYDANKEPGTLNPNAGKGILPFDGAVGNIVNGALATAIMYVAHAVQGFDVTALPDAIEPAVAGLIVTASGLLLTKVLPRFRPGAR